MKTSRSFPPGAELLDLGDGIAVPAEVEVTAEDVNGYTVTLTATYDPATGRYGVRSAAVRAGDGAEVTGEVLRSIPVATILRHGIMGHFLTPMELPDQVGRSGPTTETLRWVARIYRLALLVGDAPTQAVAAALDVPRSTAGRWVTRARDRGLLTVIDPRATRTE